MADLRDRYSAECISDFIGDLVDRIYHFAEHDREGTLDILLNTTVRIFYDAFDVDTKGEVFEGLIENYKNKLIEASQVYQDFRENQWIHECNAYIIYYRLRKDKDA